MNSTQESSDVQDNQSAGTIGFYGYSIAVSFGIILFIIFIIYSYNVYTRSRSGGNSIDTSNTRSTTTSTDYESHCPKGLDEATLLNYPKKLYSQFSPHERGCSASGCSICLQDYKDIDMLRQLPECGHFFHLNCVDPWLRLHPTCPICRKSPMPTPLNTPLAGVEPPATRSVDGIEV